MTDTHHNTTQDCKSAQKQNGRLPCGQRQAYDSSILCLGLDLHGWLRLVTYWLIFFVRPIGYSAMGVFVVEFVEHFRTASQAQIAWIAACHLGATPLVCSIPIGWLTERFGSRVVVCVTALIGTTGLILSSLINNLPSLYIGYGVMLGCCVISYQIIGSILVQTTLPVRRNLFAGISFTFLSAGAFVWPAVSRVLIDAFSWQGALLILAAINLNVAALSQLLPNYNTSRPESQGGKHEVGVVLITEEKEHSHNGYTPSQTQIKTETQIDTDTQINTETQKSTEIQIKADTKTGPELLPSGGNSQRHSCTGVCGRTSYPLLLVFCMGYLCNQITLYSVFMYLPSRCKEEGYTKRQAVLLVSLISISGCIFRTPAGALGDVRCINPCYVTAAANVVTGVTCVLSTLCSSLPGLVLASCVIGSAMAFFVALTNASTEYVVGKSRLGMGFAILNSAQGLAMIIGLPLSGFFLDHLGTSHSLFLYIGGSGVLGGSLVLLAGILRRSSLSCTRSSQ